jgi:hypothetical protein
MNIRFVRSGGFTGMRIAYELDTKTLSPDESQRVAAFVESANFFVLPEKIMLPGRGADQFTYTVTIDREGTSHTIQVVETAVPATLRPLIRYLVDMAKK